MREIVTKEELDGLKEQISDLQAVLRLIAKAGDQDGDKDISFNVENVIVDLELAKEKLYARKQKAYEEFVKDLASNVFNHQTGTWGGN